MVKPGNKRGPNPNRRQGKGKDEQLLSLFERAERRGMGLKRQSYTWAVVAYKRCGRTKEAVDAAASFSKRGIVVSFLCTPWLVTMVG